jgi:hypothetical protein
LLPYTYPKHSVLLCCVCCSAMISRWKAMLTLIRVVWHFSNFDESKRLLELTRVPTTAQSVLSGSVCTRCHRDINKKPTAAAYEHFHKVFNWYIFVKMSFRRFHLLNRRWTQIFPFEIIFLRRRDDGARLIWKISSNWQPVTYFSIKDMRKKVHKLLRSGQ